MRQTFEVTLDLTGDAQSEKDVAVFEAAHIERLTDGMVAYDADGERLTTFDRDQLIGVSMSGEFR